MYYEITMKLIQNEDEREMGTKILTLSVLIISKWKNKSLFFARNCINLSERSSCHFRMAFLDEALT